MGRYILAIDQGTTGSRCFIFDSKGKVLSSSYQEFPQYFPKPGWVEHDANQIWSSVDAVVKKADTITQQTWDILVLQQRVWSICYLCITLSALVYLHPSVLSSSAVNRKVLL